MLLIFQNNNPYSNEKVSGVLKCSSNKTDFQQSIIILKFPATKNSYQYIPEIWFCIVHLLVCISCRQK